MIHPSAMISSGAQLGADVSVGPFAVIEEDTLIGDRCEIRAHAVIKRHTTLGRDNRVHEGAVLGGEPQDLAWDGSASRLVIGERNVLREGVTVHRSSAAGGSTAIGSDCFVMAYAHVAHDDAIGDGVILANNVALAGHVQIAERAFLSGGVVVHQFCRIGRLAMIGGNAKVIKDCLPFVVTDGHPARSRGLNLVGLRRVGFTASQVRALKQAFRILLRSTLALETALAQMAELGDRNVDEMIAFCRASRRGFHKGARERGQAGE